MIIILILWISFFGVAIWAVHFIKIEFKFTYFLAEGAYVKQYYDLSEKYFKFGANMNIYTSGNFDFSEDLQLKLQDMNLKIRKCDQCKKPYTLDNSFTSWYV